MKFAVVVKVGGWLQHEITCVAISMHYQLSCVCVFHMSDAYISARTCNATHCAISLPSDPPWGIYMNASSSLKRSWYCKENPKRRSLKRNNVARCVAEGKATSRYARAPGSCVGCLSVDRLAEISQLAEDRICHAARARLARRRPIGDFGPPFFIFGEPVALLSLVVRLRVTPA